MYNYIFNKIISITIYIKKKSRNKFKKKRILHRRIIFKLHKRFEYLKLYGPYGL